MIHNSGNDRDSEYNPCTCWECRELRLQLRPVAYLVREHWSTWRDKDDCYWLVQLVEEVGELAQSLVGEHEHEPELELAQIASICVNWLTMRQRQEALGLAEEKITPEPDRDLEEIEGNAWDDDPGWY